MNHIIYGSFALLAVVCAILQFLASSKNAFSSGNNPNFLAFQRKFFVVYFFALFSDWLQGPYVYKLYSHYGFSESQIAVLYTVGFASSVVFGTATGPLADVFGRKKMCIAFSIIYSICCITKVSRNFALLFLGRVCGGIATSVLFSAFESWYIHEHLEQDFPTEWISVTFSKATFWNGVLAIVAGIAANASAEWLAFGPVAPFILAIPFLMCAGGLIFANWTENYGDENLNLRKSCYSGLREILYTDTVLMLGSIQSLFESVMYIFVFIWTPVLEPISPPLGIVFSSFMVCIMIGSSIHDMMSSRSIRPENILLYSLFLFLGSLLLCVISTHPVNSQNPLFVSLSYLAFLMLEVAIGMYFPAIIYLRSQVIPEDLRAGIMNWFRVPLNTITCFALIYMHNENTTNGNQKIFGICAALILVGILVNVRFNARFRATLQAKEEKASIQTQKEPIEV